MYNNWSEPGRGPEAPEGVSPEGSDIVPFDESSAEGDHNGARVPKGAGPIVALVGGAVCVSGLSALGPGVVAAGYSLAHRADDVSYKGLTCALAIVGAIVAALASDATAAPGAVVMAVVGLVVAWLYCSGSMTSGRLLLVVAATTVAHLLVDEALMLLSGTTLSAYMASYVDAYADLVSEAYGSYDLSTQLEVSSTLSELTSFMGTFWPMMYAVAALVEYLSAHVGLWLALGGRRGQIEAASGSGVRVPGLVEFDVPLLVVALFLASLAVYVVESTVGAVWSELVYAISANLTMSLRFAFVLQGAAVVSWLLSRFHSGPFLRLAAWILAITLELDFYVVTIVGLVDVWANFRHLERGGRPGAQDAPQQG